LVGRHGREARSRLRADLGDPEGRARDHHEHDDDCDDRTGEAADTRHAFRSNTTRDERPPNGAEWRTFITAREASRRLSDARSRRPRVKAILGDANRVSYEPRVNLALWD
jgi:hypothetical protein